MNPFTYDIFRDLDKIFSSDIRSTHLIFQI